MRKFWIIVKEVYRKNTLSKSFLTMTFAPVILIAVIFAVMYFTGGSEEANIGIVDFPAAMQAVIETSDDGNTYTSYSLEEAETALKNEDITAYVTLSEGDVATLNVYKLEKGKSFNLNNLQKTVQFFKQEEKAREIGLSQADRQVFLQATANIEETELSYDKENDLLTPVEKDAKLKNFKLNAGLFIVIIVYMYIVFYMQLIGQEVSSEKGSRIMEVLLSSSKASYHFIGKLVAMLLVALTQVLVYVALFLIIYVIYVNVGGREWLANNYPGLANMQLGSMFSQSKNELLLIGLMALAGVLLYSSLAALISSLVENRESLSQALNPILILVLIGYFVAIQCLNYNPAYAGILAYVPFFSPFIVPVRFLKGNMGMTGFWISFAICIITFLLSIKLGVTFYKSNILSSGGDSITETLKKSYELWKSERKAKRA